MNYMRLSLNNRFITRMLLSLWQGTLTVPKKFSAPPGAKEYRTIATKAKQRLKQEAQFQSEFMLDGPVSGRFGGYSK